MFAEAAGDIGYPDAFEMSRTYFHRHLQKAIAGIGAKAGETAVRKFR
jgi:hypothetical protein